MQTDYIDLYQVHWPDRWVGRDWWGQGQGRWQGAGAGGQGEAGGCPCPPPPALPLLLRARKALRPTISLPPALASAPALPLLQVRADVW